MAFVSSMNEYNTHVQLFIKNFDLQVSYFISYWNNRRTESEEEHRNVLVYFNENVFDFKYAYNIYNPTLFLYLNSY